MKLRKITPEEKVRNQVAEELCREEYRKSTCPEDFDRAYRKYLDTIGGCWPEFMIATWYIVYGTGVVNNETLSEGEITELVGAIKEELGNSDV